MFKAKDAAIVDNVALFVVSVSSLVNPFVVVVGAVIVVAISPSTRLVKRTTQRFFFSFLRVIPVSSQKTHTVNLLCVQKTEIMSDKAP